jgi:hypothetical protein
MRAFIAVTLVLLGFCGVNDPARAAQPDKCQDCRDYHRACIKAHSQNACKNDYDICMKHCRQK